MIPDLITQHVASGYHAFLKANRAEWEKLPYVGVMMGLQLRNCPCGSTLAIEMGDEK